MTRMFRFIARPMCAIAACCAAALLLAGRGAAAQLLPYHHLYVADGYYNTVYRFPLGAGGLPATQPDATLQYSGFSAIYGLAVDPLGDLYVASFDNDEIDVFAPGATGNARPTWQLSLGTHSAQNIAVNGQGYLFVDDENLNGISIYAPGARGQAQPLHTISNWGPADSIIFFTLDGAGRLYVLAPGPIDVFENPLKQWVYVDYTLQPEGIEFEWGSVMAVDQPNGRLYIEYYPEDEFPSNPFSVRSIAQNFLPDMKIATNACSGGGTGIDSGAAVSGSYLVFSCLNNASVYVYRADDFGMGQTPVETIGRFLSPTGVIVGP